MKEDCPPSAHVAISDSKSILKSELLNLLKTYNCYHKGRSLQLRHREEEEALIIEGLLNIAWGLRRPIRLQIQDGRERGQLSASWTPGRPSCHPKEPPLQDGRFTAQEQGDQPTPREESSRASSEPPEEEEEAPQLMRTRSDAAGVIGRRPGHCAPGDAQRIWRHRFSINRHFYDHKTSVFTPAYGSVTNVRVDSTMTARHVLVLLLNKFRVQNGPSEFALYVVHESGERTKLKDGEYPLISRILHGPCEKIARIFLMEADLGEEVPHDVAQYIKFEMPVLDSFVEKLKEEEEREIIKLTKKCRDRFGDRFNRQVPGPAHGHAAASAAAGGHPVAHGQSHGCQWADTDQGPPAGEPHIELLPVHLPKDPESRGPGSWLPEPSQDPEPGQGPRNSLDGVSVCGWPAQ